MARARSVSGLEPDTPFGEAAARVVEVRAHELFDHADGVLDTADIERVHDMRVASRRLRAVLEIFAPCFPRKLHASVLGDVKRLADALGDRRDPDVHVAALATIADGLAAADRRGVESLADRLREEQASANGALADALADAERSDLRGRLAALVAGASS